MRIFPIVLLALPIGAHAALHFGAGVAYYDDEYIHYTDKGYYDDFSMDWGGILISINHTWCIWMLIYIQTYRTQYPESHPLFMPVLGEYSSKILITTVTKTVQMNMNKIGEYDFQ